MPPPPPPPPPLSPPSSSSESRSQWSNLPHDILTLILFHFETLTDLNRFRSICKSWRYFANPTNTHLIFPLFLPPHQPNSLPFSLCPLSLYILSKNRNVWLVKVSETVDGRKLSLINPLTNNKLYFPSGFRPNLINLLGFESYLVGRSYKVQLKSDLRENVFDFDGFSSLISFKKVVVKTFESVAVLGLCENGRILGWKTGEDKWVSFNDGEKTKSFDDVVCFHGHFYAVDRVGRLVMVDSSSFEVVELVSPVENGDYNQYTYLVVSNFRLYLVIKVVSRPRNYYDDEEEEWIMDKTTVGKPLAFKVYVFSQREKEWQKVDSLENMVFFLSRDAAFSVCAEDLGWSKGNCIYFEGLTGYDDEADMAFGLNAGVYSLENHDVSPSNHDVSPFNSLADDKAQIFFPPSNWYQDCVQFENMMLN